MSEPLHVFFYGLIYSMAIFGTIPLIICILTSFAKMIFTAVIKPEWLVYLLTGMVFTFICGYYLYDSITYIDAIMAWIKLYPLQATLGCLTGGLFIGFMAYIYKICFLTNTDNVKDEDEKEVVTEETNTE